MAAERNLYRGREPAEAVVRTGGKKERGLREVHLGGELLHPQIGPFTVEEADRGGISLEGARRERVDLEEPHWPIAVPTAHT
jgi:hypothetical protein